MSVQSNWERNCPRAVLHGCITTTLSEEGIEGGSGSRFFTLFAEARSSEKLHTCPGAGESQFPALNISVVLKHSIKLQQLEF